MNSTVSKFNLKVQQVEQVCLFELSWGQGQHLEVKIPYLETLTKFYQEWQDTYLNFYKRPLRGRVVKKGQLSVPVDWHAKLVEAEAKLLAEFHRWLRHEELFEIRASIAKAASDHLRVELSLSVTPLELSRLPWEAWEIGTEFAASGKIRILRTIYARSKRILPAPRQRKARVLAILGDDTGLDFQVDKQAVKSLSSIAEIVFVGWQPGQSSTQLKTQIAEAIKDARGWDVLFFAGHSNETSLTGGELGIAPNISLSLREIEQPLTLAIQRGLQFALFNSCKGLSLANTLIGLGLSQVAVMREPVHNRVAQEFLLQFLRSLAEYKDAHDAMLAACQFLKLEKQITYPSAYLIPSLFRHPEAPVFRLEPYGWKQKLKRWLPTKTEAIAVGVLCGLSWQLSVQELLLDQRLWVQSVYRQMTLQTPTHSPPVLMVSIDEESIKRARISAPRPMNRRYLAQIIDQLALLDSPVVGVDYLLDRHQPENDPILANSVRQAVEKRGTWFIFATKSRSVGGWFEVLPEIADPNWSFNGDLRVLGYPPHYMSLVPLPEENSQQRLPLSYLLALGYWVHYESTPNESTPSATTIPKPQLDASSQLLSQVRAYLLETTTKDYGKLFSPKAVLHPLTNWAYLLRQWWLQPIIDFSIPPEQVYQTIPAWQLLEQPSEIDSLIDLDQYVILIAPGGYGEAGVETEGEDNYPVPSALAYWRSQQNPPDLRPILPGGEVHAYMVHHWLNRRLVTPIPDLWMLAIAALLGKGTVLAVGQISRKQWKKILAMIAVSGIYGGASLQLYITGGILFPWFLPTLTFWTYIVVAFVERKSYG
ncbi:CHASE2 domain-containing protein [Capilliphycus salinus ALCB114379]|uniref:CHASE2 domain-containing protein n=1 Tax=Capilliphycus salinus TaxID=2768948 RepID=UPI0039A57EA4